ncbi:hypothetical protein FRB99_002857, partial [Tulasnella sp. 403]
TYPPIIVGTIDTPLIKAVVDATHLNVVKGSDRRGIIYALYELSEQFGVSPWHCTQSWTQAKFTNGTSQPFNHLFYEKFFGLVLRIRANTLWPAMWEAVFGVDDPINQATAHYFGVVMGTSHQEPTMRSSPNEFNLLYPGQAWDRWVNKQNITQYMKEVAAPYILAQLYITVGKNNLYASQARYSTNVLADAGEELFKNDYTLEKQYNTMLNSKWDHMMDQSHITYYCWQQPMMNVMPAVNHAQKDKEVLPRPMSTAGKEFVMHGKPGDDSNQCSQGYPPTLATFDPYQPKLSRYIDISAGGPNSFTWNLKPSDPWIKASKAWGTITYTQPETRVEVSINWGAIQGSSLRQHVDQHQDAELTGFVEGDGGVSIEASHPTSNTTANGVTWRVLLGYGKTLAGVKPLPVLGNDGKNFTIGTGVSHNANGNDRPLKFAVQIDNETPQTVSLMPLAVPGELPPGWDGNDGFAANATTYGTINHSSTGPGAHTLKVFMIEPVVVLE